MLDRKSHPSCPVHGVQECEGEGGVGVGMMGVYPPTSGPTPIMLLGKPSNGREVGKGVGLGNFPIRWVTEQLVNLDDDSTFLESQCACVCPITQLYPRPHPLGGVLIINLV